MRKLFVVGLISAGFLAGCAAPKLTLTNKATGTTSSGTATGADFASAG